MECWFVKLAQPPNGDSSYKACGLLSTNAAAWTLAHQKPYICLFLSHRHCTYYLHSPHGGLTAKQPTLAPLPYIPALLSIPSSSL